MCGRDFEIRNSDRDKKHCSKWCFYESTTQAERPEKPPELVEVLVQEGHGFESIHGRVLAHLRGEVDELGVTLRAARATTNHYLEAVETVQEVIDDVGRDEVLDELLEQLIQDLEFPAYTDGHAIEEAIETSSSYYEFSEKLRTNRDRVRRLARAMGVIGRFEGGYQQRELHERISVILDRDEEERWLQEDDADELQELLDPFDDDRMGSYEVSRAVNDPTNEGPSLIDPVGSDQSGMEEFG